MAFLAPLICSPLQAQALGGQDKEYWTLLHQKGRILPYQEFLRRVDTQSILNVEIDKKYMTAKFTDVFGNKGIINPFNDPEFITFLKSYGVDLSITQYSLLNDANFQFGMAAISFWTLCFLTFLLGFKFGETQNPFGLN